MLDVKPGDVLAKTTGSPGAPRKVTVEKVTKTTVIAEGKKWSRRNGFEIGGSRWSHGMVALWTAEHDAKVAQVEHMERCRDAHDALLRAATVAARNGRLIALQAALAALQEPTDA